MAFAVNELVLCRSGKVPVLGTIREVIDTPNGVTLRLRASIADDPRVALLNGYRGELLRQGWIDVAAEACIPVPDAGRFAQEALERLEMLAVPYVHENREDDLAAFYEREPWALVLKAIAVMGEVPSYWRRG